jgi:ArsR family transcriptional regulator
MKRAVRCHHVQPMTGRKPLPFGVWRSGGDVAMSEPLEPQRCAQLLRAVGEVDRLRIIYHLRDGPKYVGQLADLLEIDIVNVSHHLGILRRLGIVQDERHGRSVQYRLNPAVYKATPGARKYDYFDFGACRLEMPKSK